ncbi:MAG: hypothetical protein AAGA81_11925, partial [Acidobacteriota bacterium]
EVEPITRRDEMTESNTTTGLQLSRETFDAMTPAERAFTYWELSYSYLRWLDDMKAGPDWDEFKAFLPQDSECPLDPHEIWSFYCRRNYSKTMALRGDEASERGQALVLEARLADLVSKVDRMPSEKVPPHLREDLSRIAESVKDLREAIGDGDVGAMVEEVGRRYEQAMANLPSWAVPADLA